MSTLNDVYQFWGSDLATSSVGDLLAVSGVMRSQQRVLRRLLTNPGEYIFHPEYGAGLAQFVGVTATSDQIASVISGQMQMEPTVSTNPKPSISVTADPGSGTISVYIQYTDIEIGQPVVLSFNVSS